jgi:hypothetical protein
MELLKVWVLVFYPAQGLPIEVAAYESWGDCQEIADSLLLGMEEGNGVVCEASTWDGLK